MSEREFSEGPLWIEKKPMGNGLTSTRIISGTGAVVALCKTANGKKEANARRIVHTWNHFDEVVEALAACLAHGLDEGEPASHGYHGVSGPTRREKQAEAVEQKARAALEKARQT